MPQQLKIYALIPAGGSGSRYSETENKLLAPIAGKTVFSRTIAALMQYTGIAGFVIVHPPGVKGPYQQEIEHLVLSQKAQDLVNAGAVPEFIYTDGGKSRCASVYNGLSALPTDCDLVVIHDAARPFIDLETIVEVIKAAQKSESGAIAAIKVVNTLKKQHADTPSRAKTIEKTIARDKLWQAQTPQVFWKKTLEKAYKIISAVYTAPWHTVTDDAQLIELASLPPVSLVEGKAGNIKITTPEDTHLANSYIRVISENGVT
ncbi:MAG: 2-C-methyl-D-erythritol 4-phosphate cytidylyltransferase [Cyanobacteria bacterium P01_H01_bin.74]